MVAGERVALEGLHRPHAMMIVMTEDTAEEEVMEAMTEDTVEEVMIEDMTERLLGPDEAYPVVEQNSELQLQVSLLYTQFYINRISLHGQVCVGDMNYH